MFVGRPYCRYLCPYGGLLAWCTRLARRGVTITPDKELDCGLCAEACPYGAIEKMRAVRRNCLYCARCYAACPRDGDWRTPKRIGAVSEPHQMTAPTGSDCRRAGGCCAWRFCATDYVVADPDSQFAAQTGGRAEKSDGCAAGAEDRDNAVAWGLIAAAAAFLAFAKGLVKPEKPRPPA